MYLRHGTTRNKIYHPIFQKMTGSIDKNTLLIVYGQSANCHLSLHAETLSPKMAKSQSRIIHSQTHALSSHFCAEVQNFCHKKLVLNF